ncbi:MAG: CsgG/HfaB family protein [Sphingomonas pseudosanguinis]|uniref:CsgG/HfaB family protein n=1 Tax=Sphingomonas pseudosanguinis TaxID=413712 RepID=UPI0039198FCB
MKTIATIFGIMALAAAPASAQKLGKGGVGVDEQSELPQCAAMIGTVALVEDRSATDQRGTDDLPAGLRALVRMAEQQNGGGARVDPLPLLKLLTARSNCFQIVDRGQGFTALQRERELAAGGSVAAGSNAASLRAADFLLTAQVVYSDNNAGGNGGAIGGLMPGGLGFKTKKMESQTILTLVEVKTGIQRAVATGSARKKDLSILGGGILANAGVGALGGAYTSTDIGKVTSLALLDAMRKLLTDARATMPPMAAAVPPAGATPVAGAVATAPIAGAR